MTIISLIELLFSPCMPALVNREQSTFTALVSLPAKVYNHRLTYL